MSKRESPPSSASKFAILNVLVRFILTTLHASQVALCHYLLRSITSGPGHKLSALLPLKRNFRYSLGPTPRAITNFLNNYFTPSMSVFFFVFVFFLSREMALLFVVPPLDGIPTKVLQSPI